MDGKKETALSQIKPFGFAERYGKLNPVPPRKTKNVENWVSRLKKWNLAMYIFGAVFATSLVSFFGLVFANIAYVHPATWWKGSTLGGFLISLPILALSGYVASVLSESLKPERLIACLSDSAWRFVDENRGRIENMKRLAEAFDMRLAAFKLSEEAMTAVAEECLDPAVGQLSRERDELAPEIEEFFAELERRVSMDTRRIKCLEWIR